ncbi:hypothetical protein Y032_0356g3357 [Ancylostoma ceylanicum]|uniref:Uncharacterized protein n=1 Tax=Ancylostoma ceylanicum TaxID=53326 RepID=A0A016RW42_9BILA|nr:hypothetical protein Y032_0356g3357 [Ancylostoma ceylanicum]
MYDHHGQEMKAADYRERRSDATHQTRRVEASGKNEDRRPREVILTPLTQPTSTQDPDRQTTSILLYIVSVPYSDKLC